MPYLYRCIKGSLRHCLPSLDRKCGCWYCSDLCQHCMQPSSTPYSGFHQDTESLLKFCSEECKKFWFPAPDQKSIVAASYLDETSWHLPEPAAPLLTAIIQKDDGVEQIFLAIDDLSRLQVIWHIRKLEHQHFAYFYISKDCLPLSFVWPKDYCTNESEIIDNYIRAKKFEVQSHIRLQLNKAVKECGFENFESFLKEIKTSKQVSLFHGKPCIH